MDPKILDGKWLSLQFERSIANAVRCAVNTPSPSGTDAESAQVRRPPGLGVILVGDNPASLAYVGRKEKVAKRCGFVTKEIRLSEKVSSQELREVIDSFNEDREIDGILLQLPLPHHLDSNVMLDRIHPSKDADGLHPLNQGLLMRGDGLLRPCTPSGLMRLIDLAFAPVEPGTELDDSVDIFTHIPEKDLSGKRAVVIGRSILVGKAAALLLLERNATVTVAHSKTADLSQVVQEADIIVAAVGREGFVTADMVREGAIVIDVGINRNSSGKLVGDVAYEEVASKASAITPVPGGVGPMTVIMLMLNTLKAYQDKAKLEGEGAKLEGEGS